MELIETPMFTRLIIELLPDDSYRLLQDDIGKNPQAGRRSDTWGRWNPQASLCAPWQGEARRCSTDLLLADIEEQNLHVAGIRQGKEINP